MNTTSQNSHIPSKDEYFQKLKRSPIFSLPAFFLFVLGMTILAGGTYLSISGEIPVWAATVANGFGIYFLFSIAHESMHRCLSSIAPINSFLGRVSMWILVPAAPYEIARWAHLQHHRFTNGPKDPDRFIHHGKWWTMPLRWANFDMNYMYIFFRDGGEHRKRHAIPLVISVSIFAAIIATLTYFGYGMEVLFYWFLPSRIALAMIAFVFVFLPHYPGVTSADENPYHATTTRLGFEWLLTPIMLYQNYHLIHHLYPNAPFYNYIKIWHLKYDEIVEHNPAIQKPFSLTPVNVITQETPS